jgi:hypothetical protein
LQFEKIPNLAAALEPVFLDPAQATNFECEQVVSGCLQGIIFHEFLLKFLSQGNRDYFLHPILGCVAALKNNLVKLPYHAIIIHPTEFQEVCATCWYIYVAHPMLFGYLAFVLDGSNHCSLYIFILLA